MRRPTTFMTPVAHTAEALAKAERRLARERDPRRKETSDDWRAERAVRRERRIPRNRRCPSCELIVPEPRRWVLSAPAGPVCRSCAQREHLPSTRLLGLSIAARRAELGLTAREVARRCGWSPQVQSALETGAHRITARRLDILRDAGLV